MGRFKASRRRERRFGWGTVVFDDERHITVITPKCDVVFHRYNAPRGNYSQSWRLFRQELMRRTLTSLYDVYRYANRYDITHFAKAKTPLEPSADETLQYGDNDEEGE